MTLSPIYDGRTRDDGVDGDSVQHIFSSIRRCGLTADADAGCGGGSINSFLRWRGPVTDVPCGGRPRRLRIHHVRTCVVSSMFSPIYL
jgi:hypothetical protein